MNKPELLEELATVFPKAFGEGSAFRENPDTERIVSRVLEIERSSMHLTHFNQLLHLVHEAGVTSGFFRYYFLTVPDSHVYPVKKITGTLPQISSRGIASVKQLLWGLKRFAVDSLLFWGDLRTGYRDLRGKTYEELVELFGAKRLPTETLADRGQTLEFHEIPMDDRYLIAELACKAYELADDESQSLLEKLLIEEFRAKGSRRVRIGDLFGNPATASEAASNQMMLSFAADEIANEEVESESDLQRKIGLIHSRFENARSAALDNTRLYLSVVNELDVYVATSMRTREDFRSMARDCKSIFSTAGLQRFNLRYFDPTLSAALRHEDKGLIECLMVKCCKALLYFAGTKDSFGKDSEVAMALSLGKPVIILCPDTDEGRRRADFFRDVHPLSRLIEFESGVPSGAIITQDKAEAATLLGRVFENEMEYDLDVSAEGYYRLKERLTGSVVRIQTSDSMLRETFWNYYHDVA